MASPSEPTTPREPEIEALGRIARGGLWCVRCAFLLAGVGFVGFGLMNLLQGRTGLSEVTPGTMVTDHHIDVVWLCLGLPLLPPVDWTFGRGRWLVLAVLAVLVAAPVLLGGDDDYGFVIRAFAGLVALASLAVWRTLWKLTTPAG
ncbi:MAG: hypothetical protein JNL12_00725 [Planctomycetes bacterium]|nr:hypothetical protein [Planctomycetota bacterium]